MHVLCAGCKDDKETLDLDRSVRALGTAVDGHCCPSFGARRLAQPPASPDGLGTAQIKKYLPRPYATLY
ncbi:hypothetical protein VYU27_003490 [Nannochloropsis oceanica]